MGRTLWWAFLVIPNSPTVRWFIRATEHPVSSSALTFFPCSIIEMTGRMFRGFLVGGLGPFSSGSLRLVPHTRSMTPLGTCEGSLKNPSLIPR